MSIEKSVLDDLLQNADQLFDENQYQEALDALEKYTVFEILRKKNLLYLLY